MLGTTSRHVLILCAVAATFGCKDAQSGGRTSDPEMPKNVSLEDAEALLIVYVNLDDTPERLKVRRAILGAGPNVPKAIKKLRSEFRRQKAQAEQTSNDAVLLGDERNAMMLVGLASKIADDIRELDSILREFDNS